MKEWISWFDHPVPEDVKGILIQYDDGIFSDRYDYHTGKRSYREGHAILGWKFMERIDQSEQSVQCDQSERSKREDSVLNNIPEYGSQSSLNFEEWQRRCGALNIVETQ